MRLVHDNEIPFGLKNFVVLIELAANSFRAAQVLNRGEVHEIFFAINAAVLIKVSIICSVEDFIKVLVPAGVDNGAMRDDYGFGEVHKADDFEGAKGLTEAHFSIPQKFIAALKVFDGLAYGVFLFGAENNFFANAFNRNELLALLDGGDSFNRVLQIDFEPFAPRATFNFGR